MAETNIDILRVGLVPYYREENEIYVFLMTPSNPNYGGDKPQIAKGGVDDGEDYVEGALREAEEELGLKRENIGPVEKVDAFQIRSKFDGYKLIVFLTEVRDPEDFNRPHYETGWSGWLEIGDAIKRCRTDQKSVLNRIQQRLK